MLGKRPEADGVVGIGGWEDRTGGPSGAPTLGNFLYGDQAKCFHSPLEGGFTYTFPGRCQFSPVHWRWALWAGARGRSGRACGLLLVAGGTGATRPQVLSVQLSLKPLIGQVSLKRKTISKEIDKCERKR